MYKLNAKAYVLIFAILGAVAFFFLSKTGVLEHGLNKIAPAPKSTAVTVPDQTQLPDFATNAGYTPPKMALPSSEPVAGPPQAKILEYGWNGHSAFNLANGGPRTTRGSLMERNGLNLVIERQDMQGNMIDRFCEFAEAYHDGRSALPIVFTQMGDGGPACFDNVNRRIKKLGPGYRIVVIGAVGRSYGEDAFWGPKEWMDNPESMRGGVVCGVPRDGDWNIALQKLALDKIPNNPNADKYDPNALNWVYTDDFTKAADGYVAGTVYHFKNIKEGKKVQGFVTWSPVEKAAIEQVGGIVRIMSTKDNPAQMATVICVLDKWAQENPRIIEGMLNASFDAAEQMNHHDAWFDRGMEANAAIFGQFSAEEWGRWFRGFKLRDAKGELQTVGGSGVFNLNDAKAYFGLDGSGDKYAAVYEQFGRLTHQQFPRELPSYPPYADVIDMRYLRAVASRSTTSEPAVTTASFTGRQRGEQVAAGEWHINFQSGSAQFDASASEQLSELTRGLTVSGETFVEITGHTDADGSTQQNELLGQFRADAVAHYLKNTMPGAFPEGRLKTDSMGEREPVASNDTPEGKAQNRRVIVALYRLR